MRNYKQVESNIVIAGSYDEYDYWMKKNRKSPKNHKYVYHEDDLRGLENVKVILAGNYGNAPVTSSSLFQAFYDSKRQLFRPLVTA